MQTPVSTYRLQLSPEFTFENLKEIVDYLYRFQISTIYSAPFFTSMEGSTHGYDVVDPLMINPAIGDIETFRSISSDLKVKKMDWLQDIVPNHMANSPSNPWLHSIYEHGPKSPYYNFFDINWDYQEWKGKVMTPFLGDTLENVLDKGELKIINKDQAFWLQYYDTYFPLSTASYPFILGKGSEHILIDSLSYNGNTEEWEGIKLAFFKTVSANAIYKAKVQEALDTINSSRDYLLQLLDLQYFRPAYWKDSEKKINFRRFFTINDLICLKIEEPQVFQEYHRFILQLIEEGLITGLRIDHIDGLYDPKKYLDDLNKLLGKDFYVIIEKILEAGEKLPDGWKTQGTSGYDFLALTNNLFTDSNNSKIFQQEYDKFKPDFSDYQKLIYDKKQYILNENMGGELKNLWSMLEELLPGDLRVESVMKAFSSFLCSFPVYRIYPEIFPLTDDQEEIVNEAYNYALKQEPHRKQGLDYIKSLFTGEADVDQEKMMLFLKRCQQFTGPLAAKGVEDTTFYLFNKLISHNEVGDSPERLGIKIKEFHESMIRRYKEYPLTINDTSTHDTKRGEDARMRINVLSEMPEEWFLLVEEWHDMNNEVRKKTAIPDRNEEYFIYQALIGAMPFGNQLEEDFEARTNAFLQKALREAKEHTNWSDPDTEFEKDIAQFVSDILNHEKFRESFDSFRHKVNFFGAVNSLGQSLIKVTAPGIPDIYQGSELWDLSYVDPDNRRPVDYNLRKQYLAEFEKYGEELNPHYLHQLMTDYRSGKIKMFTLYQALKERRSSSEFFKKAAYIPLEVSAEFTDKVISYARHYKGSWYLIAAPVNATSLSTIDHFALGEFWGQGHLMLPGKAPEEWTNVFTGESVSSNGQLPLNKLFNSFPVAMLKSN